MLYLGVARYSLYTDDQSTFHSICLFHAICDPYGPKQNADYYLLYKIGTRNDSNFTRYKITIAVLYVMKRSETC